ncbi:Trypanosomal VSG domain containing protein, putative [Trypanosoma equiperdum]|uniref:Trypanosomal VSG domain containing protein, putative n=1 Tax=Trypanosoma equiperdum TaxID=5694 RepID=A0A1G4IJC1_TRYEQ|nr:Trypanosomal VSG domain containing protein, putative [Trypanosoma equiperdum]
MLLAAVSLLALAVSNVSEGAGNNVKGSEFGFFCTLVNMLDAEDIEDVATEGLEEKANTACTEIEHMFIMTNNESYYNEDPANSPDAAGTVKLETPEEISQWKTAKKVWEKADEEGKPGNKKYKRKDRALVPQQIGAKLDRIFNRAAKIKNKIQTATQAIEQKEKEIRTAMRQALCGWQRPGDATPKPKPVAADFENTYAAACHGTTGPRKLVQRQCLNQYRKQQAMHGRHDFNRHNKLRHQRQCLNEVYGALTSMQKGISDVQGFSTGTKRSDDGVHNQARSTQPQRRHRQGIVHLRQGPRQHKCLQRRFL